MSEALVPDGAGAVPDDPLERVRVSFVQRATLERDGALEELFITDLGLQGVSVERRGELARDARVRVRFLLPGNSIPIVADCRVAWRRASAASLPAGAGLEFLTLSEPDRLRVREHIAEHCRRHPRARQFARPWPHRPGAGSASGDPSRGGGEE